MNVYLINIQGDFEMQELVERIKKDGVIKPGGVLKVDSFLNHQIDPELSFRMAEEIYSLYKDENIDRILTIEASGIGLAVMTGHIFGCPVVFAKKTMSANISDNVYCEEVYSFTKKTTKQVIVSKEYIKPGERVLLIDDFLAMGSALRGLRSIVEQAGGTVVGAAIAIEKAFQPGGDDLRKEGMRIESLARVASMGDDSIEFCD